MMWERRIPVSFQLFLGVNSPITRPILEGPRGRFKQRKSRISATPEFGARCELIQLRELPRRPYTHARIPKISGRRPNSFKLAA